MVMSKFRGSDVVFKNGAWYFRDTNMLVSETYKNHKCGNCGGLFTKEGHDNCLGILIGTKNACCGHGDINEAYIQFLDGECIRGEDAIIVQKILKNTINSSD